MHQLPACISFCGGAPEIVMPVGCVLCVCNGAPRRLRPNDGASHSGMPAVIARRPYSPCHASRPPAAAGIHVHDSWSAACIARFTPAGRAEATTLCMRSACPGASRKHVPQAAATACTALSSLPTQMKAPQTCKQDTKWAAQHWAVCVAIALQMQGAKMHPSWLPPHRAD